MTINTVAQVTDAYNAGRHWTGYLRRAGPAMTLGTWMDMSYAAGIPVANYYAATPLQSAQLAATDGIMHGPPVNAAGFKKYLHKAMILPPTTSVGLVAMHLHDIVAYYPFVDGDGGSQDMVNTLGTLRYSGGVGCRIMFVSQGAGVSNAVDATVTYTNSAGVQKTQSGVYLANTASAGQVMGHVNAAALGILGYKVPNPYLELNPGDTGVARIDNISLPSSVGGIFAAVIVKPLATISWQELLVPIEVDYMADRQRMAEIEDGACIHAVARGTVTATPATLLGELNFVWG